MAVLGHGPDPSWGRQEPLRTQLPLTGGGKQLLFYYLHLFYFDTFLFITFSVENQCREGCCWFMRAVTSAPGALCSSLPSALGAQCGMCWRQGRRAASAHTLLAAGQPQAVLHELPSTCSVSLASTVGTGVSLPLKTSPILQTVQDAE